MLQVLGAWGQQVGHTWQLSTPGVRGCTAVHLAAAIRDAVLLKALAGALPLMPCRCHSVTLSHSYSLQPKP